MKRSALPLVGAARVVALAAHAEGAASSPQVADPSLAEGPRDPQELTGAVVQALAPAIARGLGFDLQAAVRARVMSGSWRSIRSTAGRSRRTGLSPSYRARWWWRALR